MENKYKPIKKNFNINIEVQKQNDKISSKIYLDNDALVGFEGIHDFTFKNLFTHLSTYENLTNKLDREWYFLVGSFVTIDETKSIGIDVEQEMIKNSNKEINKNMSSQTEVKIVINRAIGNEFLNIDLKLNNESIQKIEMIPIIDPKFSFLNLFKTLSEDTNLIHQLDKNWINVNYSMPKIATVKEATIDTEKEIVQGKQFPYQIDSNNIMIDARETIQHPLQTKLDEYQKELKETQLFIECSNIVDLDDNEYEDLLATKKYLEKLIIITLNRLNRI